MKAVCYDSYGPTTNLSYQEVPKPMPKENEVLIRVHAVSINSWDWDLVRGKPFYVRLVGGGLRRPSKQIIGCDVSGVIEEIGKNVTRLKVGDEVFGDLSECGWGGFAEYACATEKSLTIKPDFISHEEASAIPQAGVMALQGVRDFRQIGPGDQVLINGAGGGVGTFAIQMAKQLGAEVSGVDRASKLKLMKELGADFAIDFEREDFTKGEKKYDLILDVVGHHSIYDFKRVLKTGGMYRMIGGSASLILQGMLVAPFISMISGKKMGILGHEPNKNMGVILDQIRNKVLRTIIDDVYPLADLVKGMDRLGSGMAHGKVVIRVK